MEKQGKVILGLACAAVFALATATTSNAVALVDPGAEAQTVSPTANGYNGWSLFNGAAFNNTQAHSGSWSIELAGGTWSVPGAYQQFAASAGQQFTFSGWGLVTNVLQLAPANNPGFPWVGLQISFFNAATNDIGTVETGGVGAYATAASKIEVGEPTGWTFLTVTATAPLNTASIQVFGINLNANGDVGWVDDMNLTLVPEPSTVGLALTGLLGLVAFGWKKRRV